MTSESNAPRTFVVDRTGTIRIAYVEDDYSRRLDSRYGCRDAEETAELTADHNWKAADPPFSSRSLVGFGVFADTTGTGSTSSLQSRCAKCFRLGQGTISGMPFHSWWQRSLGANRKQRREVSRQMFFDSVESRYPIYARHE
jgi:hypothetical protein